MARNNGQIFEIEDALQKLVRLQMVETRAGKFNAVEQGEAVKRLDAQWDNYFSAA